jgi:hypothetical protein
VSVVKSNTLQLGQSLTATNNFCWYQPSSPDGTVRLGNGNAGSVTDLVTVNSSGNVGIGTSSPNISAAGTALTILGSSTNRANLELGSTTAAASSVFGQIAGYNGATLASIVQLFGDGATDSGAIKFFTKATGGAITERLRLDSSGNLGLGVTPSASWQSTRRVLQVGGSAALWAGSSGSGSLFLSNNAYFDGTNFRYLNTSGASYFAQLTDGSYSFHQAASGTAGNAISFTQAMTLDASGNLLVGTTTSTARLTTTSAGAEGTVEVSFLNGGCQFFVNSVGGANAAATVQRIGRISTNSRSINAGGTINASGADYAEYMIKAGDFEIAKGEVCGIDANGLLTNVFADAVSFVVKSTDPSYVGGDSWGAGIEDQDALEAERQKVDRIAFAGQVPVNVLGAKAGDYIIPVVDKKGISGETVTSPTFEQYQIAVGKVIAIEPDGRARIIVKVA